MLLVFGMISLIAQTDGFFSYYNGNDANENECREGLVILPRQHGYDYNYYADNVALESGSLLLFGMGLFYLRNKIIKRKD